MDSKNIKNIDDAVILYEDILRDITENKNIIIYLVKKNKLYSPRLKKRVIIDDTTNGILAQAYFTKRVYNIKDVTDSFLYNSHIDNLNNIDNHNILVIPLLEKNKYLLALIQIEFQDSSKEYQEIINPLMSEIIELIASLKRDSLLEYVPTALLVDDSFIMLKFISSILKKYNFNIVTATSGLEAIEKFKHQKIDLIFMDDVMVGLSGYETISIIREMERKDKQDPIPIFGVTSDTTREANDMIINSGANFVFHKPIKNDEIVRVLRLYMFIE